MVRCLHFLLQNFLKGGRQFLNKERLLKEPPNPQLLGFFRSHGMAEARVDDNRQVWVEAEHFDGELFAREFRHGLVGNDCVKLMRVGLKNF